MTGLIEEVEEEDASSELLAISIIVMLLLLRVRAHYRHLSSAQLTDLEALAKATIARADITVAPQAARLRLASRVAGELDDLITRHFDALLRLLQAELDALAQTLAQAGAKQINEAVGADVAVVPRKERVSGAVVAMGILGASLLSWVHHHRDALRFQVRRVMATAPTTSRDDTLGALRAAMDTARRNVEVLVNTAIGATHATVADEILIANPGVVKGIQHCSILDSKVSDLCRSRSGARWLADGTPVGHTKELRRPPLHPNCRSSLIHWMPAAKDLPPELRARVDATGKAGRLTGRAPKEPTLGEFLKTRSEAEQKKILGEAQWRLWQQGKITTSDLLNQSSRPLTLSKFRRFLGLD